MRILFYSSGIYTGGVATAFRAVATELETAGHEVGLIVPYESDIACAAVERRHILGFGWHHRCRSRCLNRILTVFNILTRWRFYFTLVKKYPHDVFCQFLASPNYQWARYVKTPTACWLHALAPRQRNTLSGRIWRNEIRRNLNRFKYLIAVSPAVATSWMSEYNLAKEPVVIENPIDCERIIKRGGKCRWPFIASSHRRIVCVGRMSPEKGQMRLLYALKKLECVEAVFIGEGSERKKCEHFVEGNGLSLRVTFLGANEDPYPYIHAADLTVIPSTEEGFGLVAVESILIGTPVMSTDCGGTRYALRNGRYGMLVANSDEGILKGLNGWISNPAIADPQCGFTVAQAEIKANDRVVRSRIRELVTGE